jgi:hypothetical protein
VLHVLETLESIKRLCCGSAAPRQAGNGSVMPLRGPILRSSIPKPLKKDGVNSNRNY